MRRLGRVGHVGRRLPQLQLLRRHHARRGQRCQPLGVDPLVARVGDGGGVLGVELGRGDLGDELVLLHPVALVDLQVGEEAGDLGVERDLEEGPRLPLQRQVPDAGRLLDGRHPDPRPELHVGLARLRVVARFMTCGGGRFRRRRSPWRRRPGSRPDRTDPSASAPVRGGRWGRRRGRQLVVRGSTGGRGHQA